MLQIDHAHGYQLIAQNGTLQRETFASMTAGPGEVIIEVAACGLCHTDLSFAFHGVPTRHPLPLVLGHEIAGRVVAAGEGAESFHGRSVIVPAVIPCGTCNACRAGRPTICRDQFMPGNDGNGGFATHVLVPARGLCTVPDELPPGLSLEMLSVVADAVTTPYEAIVRADLGNDDVAVVVGAGGIGSFGVQIAAAFGAAVVAIDVDDARLAVAGDHGAAVTLNPENVAAKDIRNAVRELSRTSGKGSLGLKIFEMSGTAAGQETAFGLLDHGGYLAVVGFTTDKVSLRLSNLMAFDATARGNWGCDPARYPAALDLVLGGKVKLAPFVEQHALDELPQLFQSAANHQLRRRPIVVPNGKEYR